MATQISIKKGESNPTNLSGLTLAEPVFVSTNNTLWIGKGSGITPVWVGAGICGASSGIAAGLTYQIPTLAAVKNYVTSTSITNYVSSFNGATGAVTGASLGANVFTGLNSFNAGICASGITLSSGIITAPGAGVYLTSSNTKNAKINLLGGPSSSQVELDAITVRVRNTTDGALPTFELYEATDAYSAKMQYTSSATNDATITFPAITGTVALTNQVVTSVNGQTGAVTVSGGTNVVTSFNGATGAIEGVSSVNGQTGAVTIASVSNVVSSFNGLTGTVQGVSAAVAGTGISVSGATGSVTITNTGVQSFNGATGAVTGASLGANTFTGTQTLTAGLTTSYLYASTGSTFASTLQVNGGATFSGRVDVGGNIKVVGDTQLGDTSTDSLTVFAGTTFNNRTDFAGNNNFATGLTAAGTLNTTSNIKFNGTTAKSIQSTQAPLTIKGMTSGASVGGYNAVVLGVQITDPLQLYSTTGVVDITTGVDVSNPYSTSIRLNTGGGDFGASPASISIEPITAFTAGRTLSIQDASGTIALTSQLMGAINGSTAATTAVTSFNGKTGAVTGASLGANTFTGLQTFTAGLSADGGITFNGPVTGATATFTRRLTASGGISASGGMTLDGGKVWHSLNDGPTSGLDAGQLYGVTASLYASSLSTGLLYGGLVTINAGNSAAFDITAGAGYIVTTGATFTAEPNPVITRVAWTAKTGVTLAGLTAQDTTWVYIDSSGNLQQQSTFFTDDQVQSTLAIGALVHPSRAYISLAKSIPNVSYATDKQYEQFIRAFGPLKVSGHTIQPNGANMKLDRSSGTAFILGRNYPNDPDNPSVVADNAQIDCTFWRYYRGVTADSFVTVLNQTAIDPDNYDDGTGTLHSVPSTKRYTIQRLFFFPNTPSVLGVYYGRGVYNSMAEAANNIHFEDFTEIQNTATNAIFAGYLLVKKGTTNLTTAIAADDARIIQSGQFRSTTSGGGSVSTNLDNLSDVIVTSVQDDDLLIYDTATSQWLNTPLLHIGVSRVNGLTGAVQAVSSFNGATGAITGVSSVNGQTGAVTIASTTNVVTSFNGLTGAVQGVSAAVAGTGISVSGATGAVTITNTGVQTFNGLTGAVGITAGSNITITQSGNTYTISAAAASSGATATYSVTTSTNANATRYLTFVTGACANGTSLLVDDVTTPLSYNPSTGTLNSKNIYLLASADTLSITPAQIVAGQDFSFASSVGGIYFDSPNLVQLGDVAQAANGTVLNINPAAHEGVLYNVAGGNAYMGINRDSTSNDFAVEVNSGGNALQLMYATPTGAATTKADFVIDSVGKLTVAPSGGTLAVTGNLTANNLVYSFNGRTGAVQGVSAAVAGTGISVSGATGAVTITNTGVQSFNGSTGAVTGVSRVNGLSGGVTFAAGTGITLTASGNTITVASAPKSTTQTLNFSENINGLEIVIYGSGESFATSLKYIEALTSISVSVNGYSCTLVSIKSFYDATYGWSARVIVKPPFTGSISAETVYLESISGVSISGNNGAVSVDDTWTNIASSEIYHQEETYAVKTVTGQTWVTADSYITCKVLGITTADHTPEDAILEGVQFEINNIVAGTGFDIIGHAPEGTYGKYTVKCIEQ